MHSLYLPQHDALVHWHDLAGTGLPLVCLPALSFAAAANFLDVVCDPALADARRILIDLPGSGFSEAAQDFDHTPRAHAAVVARVLDHLKPGPCVLFGHSMGGSVAMALAAARPDLVHHLVVAEGNLRPGGGAASRGIAQQDGAAYPAGGYPAQMHDIRAKAISGQPFYGFLHASWRLADPGALHGNASGLVDLDPELEQSFLNLACPRTYLYGAKSLARNVGSADVPEPELLRARGVGTEVIPDAGHFMTRDNPAAVARVLARILAQPQGHRSF
ncbi:alpha/beta fold hydrolase [Puniceibacterium confluentis]|uniref:alpha/beta fold hydrolase n=1 Tax=Puniceibacterium confluentis TaxID=1958944 RepID=UPI0011B66B60|nr:alpha/beta hydrolase [Puniceibacterium confluentis]